MSWWSAPVTSEEFVSLIGDFGCELNEWNHCYGMQLRVSGSFSICLEVHRPVGLRCAIHRLIKCVRTSPRQDRFHPLALELDIYSLAHNLCKMWIILWTKKNKIRKYTTFCAGINEDGERESLNKYLLTKYIKSVLWRVMVRLSYIQDAWCLKVEGEW